MPLLRTLVPKSLEVFDFAEQGLVTGSRDTTTVPSQALYLLNDAFVRKQALVLAEELTRRSELSDEARVSEAYLRVVGLEPTVIEVERACEYIRAFASEAEVALADVFAARSQAAPLPIEPKVAKAEPSVADASSNIATAQTQAAPLANPDDVAQEEEIVIEEAVEATNARTAPWHSFVRALIGTFRKPTGSSRDLRAALFVNACWLDD